VIKAMKNSGIPLHFPRSLGGWGLPGKPEAPIRFRKAAASILIGQSQLQERLHAVFLCSKAPPYLRKKIRKGLNTIQAWPERFSPSAVPRDIEDVTTDYTSRLLAFHGRDPTVSKLQDIKYANLGTIAKRINRTIDEAVKYWKSAKPMKAGKAVLLDQTYRARLVDSQYLDLLLARRGVYDGAVRDLLTGQERSKFLPKLPRGYFKNNLEVPGHQETLERSRADHFMTSALLLQGKVTAESPEGRRNQAWRSSLQGSEKRALKNFLELLANQTSTKTTLPLEEVLTLYNRFAAESEATQ
jgi:hypothetical protein